MSYFYCSRYRFYHKSARRTLIFFLISDIHFSNKVSSEKLYAITKQAQQLEPNYILIPGDLIDSLDAIDDKNEFDRLTNWLMQLGEIAPTFICLGNHDFYRKNPAYNNILSKEHRWLSEKNQHFINTVDKIDNVKLLDNQSYKDHNVYIFGFTQSPAYFRFDQDKRCSSTIFRPGSEKLDVMLSDLENIDQKLISKLPKHKIKIALIHSPVFLTNPKIAAKLCEFDFLISGHMHNGVVPPIINDFWRSDRGLIAPGKKLFPHGSRTKIRSSHDKIITLGAVSTLQASVAKPINLMNGIYPINIASLELSRSQNLIRKPDVQYQYLSP